MWLRQSSGLATVAPTNPNAGQSGELQGACQDVSTVAIATRRAEGKRTCETTLPVGSHFTDACLVVYDGSPTGVVPHRVGVFRVERVHGVVVLNDETELLQISGVEVP